jgi:hypothetical protein
MVTIYGQVNDLSDSGVYEDLILRRISCDDCQSSCCDAARSMTDY